MLKLLRALPPNPHEDSPDNRSSNDADEFPLSSMLMRKGVNHHHHHHKQAPKKKRQNLIKVQKGSADYGQGINPISRLIQIQQAKREKEPTFSLLTERGLPRRREFIMQVTVIFMQKPFTCDFIL